MFYIEIVHCEPKYVVDVNDTNVEIDFAPMFALCGLYWFYSEGESKQEMTIPTESDSESRVGSSYFQGKSHKLSD